MRKNEYTAWQLRRKRLVQPILAMDEFQREVDTYRQGSDNAPKDAAMQLIRKYHLPEGQQFIKFFANYIATGDENYLLFTPAIKIGLIFDDKVTAIFDEDRDTPESRSNRRGQVIDDVFIKIEQAVTREEFEQFVDENWSRLIAPQLEESVLAGVRIRERPNVERDENIYQMSVRGMTVAEIYKELAEDQFDISEPYIRKIISRQKHKRDI